MTIEEDVARVINPKLLSYNSTWNDIDKMLNKILTQNFRSLLRDSFGGSWIYNWHCMDHVGFNMNPRRRDFGFHNIRNHKVHLKKFLKILSKVHLKI